MSAGGRELAVVVVVVVVVVVKGTGGRVVDNVVRCFVGGNDQYLDSNAIQKSADADVVLLFVVVVLGKGTVTSEHV